MSKPDYTETIVNELISELPLRERHVIANMNETDIKIFEALIQRYIEGKGDRINNGKHVIRRVWVKLQESHRLKVVE